MFPRPTTDRPRRFTPRTALFAALLLACIGGSTAYLARQVRSARDEGLLDRGRRHNRPILRTADETLLWARGSVERDTAEWFDMTDALVDPAQFEHGVGKDSIPSIDRPVFARPDDPSLARIGINDATTVIGYEHEGEARAYPVAILNRHELVNDWVGGKPVTVGW